MPVAKGEVLAPALIKRPAGASKSRGAGKEAPAQAPHGFEPPYFPSRTVFAAMESMIPGATSLTNRPSLPFSVMVSWR